jgi:hypothetical protein
LHSHYTTVGHITIDVFDDGSRRPGGAAFFSALQAARLGLRAHVITQGVPREIEAAIEPYRDELDVRILPAAHTTTLLTAGAGGDRVQRVLAWAGPIAEEIAIDTDILHLAPVARELPRRWRGQPAFTGLTPQGLARDWNGPRGRVVHVAPDAGADELARDCQALVVSDRERESCAALIRAAADTGALVAITAGAQPTVVLAPHADALELDVPPLAAGDPVDDVGAGDVFAAAFFIALTEGQGALDATHFANAAAAVRIGGLTADAIGRRADVEERLRLLAPGR